MTYKLSDDSSLAPQFVVEVLDALTPANTVVTTGVGQHQMWAMQYWTYTEPRTWVSSHGLGAMGYGLPAAIGAKFAADDSTGATGSLHQSEYKATERDGCAYGLVYERDDVRDCRQQGRPKEEPDGDECEVREVLDQPSDGPATGDFRRQTHPRTWRR